MKTGTAMEGFIREDGTIRPSYKYDDTEVRSMIKENKDNIENIDERVEYLEKHGGAEDKTKADKVSPELEGHLAMYDEEGNLGDGGMTSQFAPNEHGHHEIKEGTVYVKADMNNAGGVVDVHANSYISLGVGDASINLGVAGINKLSSILSAPDVPETAEVFLFYDDSSYPLYDDGTPITANCESVKDFIADYANHVDTLIPCVVERVESSGQAETPDIVIYINGYAKLHIVEEETEGEMIYGYTVTLYLLNKIFRCGFASSYGPDEVQTADLPDAWTVTSITL